MQSQMYRIGEVAKKLDVKPYVLRFWETEFPQIMLCRTEKGQRLYSEENIAILLKIKELLYEQGMTIEGARKVLSGQTKDGDAIKPPSDFYQMLCEELSTLRQILAGQL